MFKTDKAQFKIGFWHPFGVHAGESRNDIITRKRKEIIDNNGWTLWSFQNRKNETIDKWVKEIRKRKQRVFVLCSDSQSAKDPLGGKFYARQYKFADSDKWKKIPSEIKVPHPFGKRNVALAFKVKAIYEPETIIAPGEIKWLCMDGKWREDSLPTRGEYLIKSGGKCRLRNIHLVLELDDPYIASLKKALS